MLAQETSCLTSRAHWLFRPLNTCLVSTHVMLAGMILRSVDRNLQRIGQLGVQSGRSRGRGETASSWMQEDSLEAASRSETHYQLPQLYHTHTPTPPHRVVCFCFFSLEMTDSANKGSSCLSGAPPRPKCQGLPLPAGEAVGS